MPEYTIRTHRPGDLGWLISQHGTLYTTEYKWNERVESLVARSCADFIDSYNPAVERCWIAEHNNSRIGCIMLAKDHGAEDAGKLRFLLVDSSARGLGVASALIRTCVDFAREVGYKRVVLWTHSVLVPARRLYEANGFKLVKEEEHDTFGVRLVGEFWELAFDH